MFLPTIPADTIDDLIYDARAGDLDSLKTTLSELSTQLQCSPAQVIAATIDAAPEAEGGTGCCLLHYPAANGNLEILTYLLTTLTQNQPSTPAVLNHKNHSGNTPLHWAALNTHLECVKALVEAGADIAATNDAGLDAVFLAERADWSAEEVNQSNPGGAAQEEEGEESGEMEIEVGETKEEEGEQKAPPSKGRQVVEWLLSSEKGGELESGVAEGQGEKKQ